MEKSVICSFDDIPRVSLTPEVPSAAVRKAADDWWRLMAMLRNRSQGCGADMNAKPSEEPGPARGW